MSVASICSGINSMAITDGTTTHVIEQTKLTSILEWIEKLQLQKVTITGDDVFKLLTSKFLSQKLAELSITNSDLLERANEPIESLSIVSKLADCTIEQRKRYVEQLRQVHAPTAAPFHFDGEQTHLSGFKINNVSIVFYTEMKFPFFAFADAGHILYENETATFEAFGYENEWLTDLATKSVRVPNAEKQSPARRLVQYLMKGYKADDASLCVLHKEVKQKGDRALFMELTKNFPGRSLDLAWILFENNALSDEILQEEIKKGPVQCRQAIIRGNYLEKAQKNLLYLLSYMHASGRIDKISLIDALLAQKGRCPEEKTCIKMLSDIGLVVDEVSEVAIVEALIQKKDPLGITYLLKSKNSQLKKKWIPHFIENDLQTALGLICRIKKQLTSADIKTYLETAKQNQAIVEGLLGQGYIEECISYSPQLVLENGHFDEKVFLALAKRPCSDEIISLVQKHHHKITITNDNAAFLAPLFLHVSIAEFAVEKTIVVLQLQTKIKPSKELVAFFCSRDYPIATILVLKSYFKQKIPPEYIPALIQAYQKSLANCSTPTQDLLSWYLSICTSFIDAVDAKVLFDLFCQIYPKASNYVTNQHIDYLKKLHKKMPLAELADCRKKAQGLQPKKGALKELFSPFIPKRDDECIEDAKHVSCQKEAKLVIQQLTSLLPCDPHNQVIGLLTRFFPEQGSLWKEKIETCKKAMSKEAFSKLVQTIYENKDSIHKSCQKVIWPLIFSYETVEQTLLENPDYFRPYNCHCQAIDHILSNCQKDLTYRQHHLLTAFLWFDQIPDNAKQKSAFAYKLFRAQSSEAIDTQMNSCFEKACQVIHFALEYLPTIDSPTILNLTLQSKARTLSESEIKVLSKAVKIIGPRLDKQACAVMLLSMQDSENPDILSSLAYSLDAFTKKVPQKTVCDKLKLTGFQNLIFSIFEKGTFEAKLHLFSLEFLSSSNIELQVNQKNFLKEASGYLEKLGSFYLQFLQDIPVDVSSDSLKRILEIEIAIGKLEKECADYFRKKGHSAAIGKLFAQYTNKEGNTKTLIALSDKLIESIVKHTFLFVHNNTESVDLSLVDAESYKRHIEPAHGPLSLQKDKTVLYFTPEICPLINTQFPSETVYIEFVIGFVEKALQIKSDLLLDTAKHYLMILLERYPLNPKTLPLVDSYLNVVQNQSIQYALLHLAQKVAGRQSASITKESAEEIVSTLQKPLTQDALQSVILKLQLATSVDFFEHRALIKQAFSHLFKQYYENPALIQNEVMPVLTEMLLIPHTKGLLLSSEPQWIADVVSEYHQGLLSKLKETNDLTFLALSLRLLFKARSGRVFDHDIEQFRTACTNTAEIIVEKNITDTSYIELFQKIICLPVRKELDAHFRENLVLWWLNKTKPEHIEQCLIEFFHKGQTLKKPKKYLIDALIQVLCINRSDTPIESFIVTTRAILDCCTKESDSDSRDELVLHWLEVVTSHLQKNRRDDVCKVIESAILKQGYVFLPTLKLVKSVASFLLLPEIKTDTFLLFSQGLKALDSNEARVDILCYLLKIASERKSPNLKTALATFLDHQCLLRIKPSEVQSVIGIFQKIPPADKLKMKQEFNAQLAIVRKNHTAAVSK